MNKWEICFFSVSADTGGHPQKVMWWWILILVSNTTGFKISMPWNGIFRVAFFCTRERIVGRPGQVSIDATLWAELPFVFLIEEENSRLCKSPEAFEVAAAVVVVRDLKIRRRRRRRERHRSKRFRLAKQQFCTCITRFCTFLCRHCTTTTWKCLISRCTEEVHKRRRDFLSLSELGYGC